MKNSAVLLIDDEISFLRSLRRLLWDEGYTNVEIEADPAATLSILKKKDFDCILLDISMPQMSGLVLLEQITQHYPDIPVIMLTANDTVDSALTAIKLGAYEYIVKPPDLERLFLTIKRGIEKRLIQKERDSLRNLSHLDKTIYNEFSDIITQSPLMYKVFDLVKIFAPTNETILIMGETGTGKDLIARKIHDLSPKKNKPFIAINVASLSSTLFESELFGHDKGAFTGASSDKAGFFEAANEGTLFLDEIGELPKELQGKLLRVLQYNEIYKVGNPNPIKLNTRIIAATNRNLLEAANKNEFRLDLYYRLTRGFLSLPPLHKRIEDLPLLTKYFMNKANETYSKKVTSLSERLISKLSGYDFPGNISELENIIFNAVATSSKSIITDIADNNFSVVK
ncbi:MAG: sigma-54 dependent transcriptional regulator, partial [Ignavibacteriaceae bacterium]|nr:sigma-54 dependent transcriptional regulator [Ignavibacteriaceae bacterium]